MVNDLLVEPAETVTLDGTVATLVSLLLRVTWAPPAGAAALSRTVPVSEFPPVTEDRLRVSDDNAAPDPPPPDPDTGSTATNGCAGVSEPGYPQRR
jgi:hypothetical protein